MAWGLGVTIASNRTLGMLGAIFTLIGAVSTALSVIRFFYPASIAANVAVTTVVGIVSSLALVGFLLFLIAMYGFSRDYGERRIFNYVLYGLLIGIVAAVVTVVFMVAFFLANLASVITAFGSTNPPSSSQVQSLMIPYLAPFLVVFSFIALINVVLDVRAFNMLGDKSAVPMFRAAAKVLLAGGLLMVASGVIFGVFAYVNLIAYDQLLFMTLPSGVIQEIAWLLLAIAFYRIQPPLIQNTNQPTASIQYAPTKSCINCNAQNQSDSIYCVQCGKKLEHT
jgi:uncharacterized membrane protein